MAPELALARMKSITIRSTLRRQTDPGARLAASLYPTRKNPMYRDFQQLMDDTARLSRQNQQPHAPTQPLDATDCGHFVDGVHSGDSGERDFKLYIPPNAGHARLPLVVMLHGCTQDPDDFATGTAMNTLAGTQGFYVLYPEQSQRVNPQGCWNWFKHSHQERGRGEPALLAGMTREVMGAHAINPERVYVAGLSAGGAMAAILGDTYPDVYSAVGVHSGLATGVASDLGSALGAMSSGASLPHPTQASGVATIVFHGDADTTVNPMNGAQVIAASAGTTSRIEIERRNPPDRRASTRSIHHAADGAVVAEHWLVHGAPHAWSGGNTQGSFTDARGPDASAEMMRFFMAHPRQPAPVP